MFRAYDDGVAYRFESSFPQDNVKVYGEEVSLTFAGNYHVYYPKEDSFFSHNEREFVYLALKDIPQSDIASLPAVIDTNDNVKLIVAESDVDDYPGLWLRGESNNSLSANLSSLSGQRRAQGRSRFKSHGNSGLHRRHKWVRGRFPGASSE